MNTVEVSTQQFVDRGYRIQLVQSHQTVRPLPFRENSELSLNPKVIKEFCKEITEALQKQYPRRGWDAEFIQKVGKNLEDYFYRSSFVIIRDLHTNEIEATLRVIASPYILAKEGVHSMIWGIHRRGDWKSLPMERDFLRDSVSRDQLVPYNTEVKYLEWFALIDHVALQSIFEISSLTIRKGENRNTVAGLLYKYFLYSSFMPSFSHTGKVKEGMPGSLFSQMISNMDNSFIYAYGDRAGRLMYLPYDFKSVDGLPAKELMGENWNALSAGDGMFSGVRSRFKFDDMAEEAVNLYNRYQRNNPELLPLMNQYAPVDGKNMTTAERASKAQQRIDEVLGGIKSEFLEDYIEGGISPTPYQGP